MELSGKLISKTWSMSMNVKMQWAVYEWCCLYFFCRLIQATAATHLLQGLGKSLNSVMLLNSTKNDRDISCTHTPCSFTIVFEKLTKSLFLFSMHSSDLAFPYSTLPHTVGCLSRTQHKRINLSASALLSNISNTEIEKGILDFHITSIGISSPNSLVFSHLSFDVPLFCCLECTK